MRMKDNRNIADIQFTFNNFFTVSVFLNEEKILTFGRYYLKITRTNKNPTKTNLQFRYLIDFLNVQLQYNQWSGCQTYLGQSSG